MSGGFGVDLNKFIPQCVFSTPDVISSPIPAGAKHPENAKLVKIDLVADASAVVDQSLDAVFIFHGIMSSGGKANFDLGMAVNIDATKNLLEALRKICPGMRVIYASIQAVYGQPLPRVVDDAVIIPIPELSYGAQKIIYETLVNDYTRRGFFDGMSL